MNMYSYIAIWNVHIRHSFTDFPLVNEEKKIQEFKVCFRRHRWLITVFRITANTHMCLRGR